MRKVYEDTIAQEIVGSIDIYWDGKTIEFDESVDIDLDASVQVVGSIDYTMRHEEDTDSTYMTWVSVDIREVNIIQYKDGEEITPTFHLNERFIQKYMEQYLLNI